MERGISHIAALSAASKSIRLTFFTTAVGPQQKLSALHCHPLGNVIVTLCHVIVTLYIFGVSLFSLIPCPSPSSFTPLRYVPNVAKSSV